MRKRALSVYLLLGNTYGTECGEPHQATHYVSTMLYLIETRLGPLTPRVQKFSVGSCPVYINIPNGIPDFYPSDASCSPQDETILKAPDTFTM